MDLSERRIRRYKDKIDTLDERLDYIDEWVSEDSLDSVKDRFAVFKAFQESAEIVADICSMHLSDKIKVSAMIEKTSLKPQEAFSLKT